MPLNAPVVQLLHKHDNTQETDMATGQEHADATGEIAITSASRRTLLHLLRAPSLTARTLCGRYPASRHTGQENVTENIAHCHVCQYAAGFTTRSA